MVALLDFICGNRPLHIRLSIAFAAASDFLQCRAEFSVVAMVATVDTEDQKAGWKILKEFVVVQFEGVSAGRIEPVVLFANWTPGTRPSPQCMWLRSSEMRALAAATCSGDVSWSAKTS